jgi:hypothetical protein
MQARVQLFEPNALVREIDRVPLTRKDFEVMIEAALAERA